MENARLIIHKDFSPSLNMAVDEALLEGSRRAGECCVLRFYSWKPACVSLGYFQKIKEVDLEKCTLYGIDCVRRLTGGQAVFHDDELTYSLIAKIDSNTTVTELFKKINKTILHGLEKIGIKAELFENKSCFTGKFPDEKKSICFSSPANYEVKVGGRKILGSAQAKRGKFILQHGSLPISIDREKLYDLFKFRNEEEKLKTIKFSNLMITSIRDELKKNISFDSLCNILAESFKENWQINFKLACLNEYESELADKFQKEKYSDVSWNHMR